MKDLSNLSAALEADSALRAAQARAKIAEAKEAGGGEVRWAVDGYHSRYTVLRKEADSAIRAARARAKIAEAKGAGNGKVRWEVDSWKEMSRDIAQDEQRNGK
jgi:hypothetical protein|tara:strand:- start:236 stop:544 length:309 start_codon:yes stop_codon:yes gene_type:complete